MPCIVKVGHLNQADNGKAVVIDEETEWEYIEDAPSKLCSVVEKEVFKNKEKKVIIDGEKVSSKSIVEVNNVVVSKILKSIKSLKGDICENEWNEKQLENLRVLSVLVKIYDVCKEDVQKEGKRLFFTTDFG